MTDVPERLKAGQIVDGEVLRLVDGPEARGRAAGREVRVALGVPGDRGRLRITRVGQNAIRAEVEALSQPSPDRVEPPCEVVARCGGCPWQTVSLQAQRAARRALLEEALGETAADATWHPWPTPPQATGYRTRSLMMLRHVGGRLRAGFFAPHTNELVPAEACPVQDPRLNRLLERVRDALDQPGLSTWRGAKRGGLLRAVLMRIDPATGRGLLTIVATREEPRLLPIAKGLLSVHGIDGVHLNLNPAEGGPVLGPTTQHLAGATRQELAIGEMTLRVGPTAFLQTSHAAGEALVALVRRFAPERIEHLLDAYAGVGVFGFALADRAARVTLVESATGAVADARAHVSRRGLGHVTALEGDAAELVPPLIAGGDAPDVVVVDPPRAGCRAPVIEALAAPGGPARIVYVSCNPRSLARDLAGLVAGGLRVTDVVPVDMFPHTPHVEAVVSLSR